MPPAVVQRRWIRRRPGSGLARGSAGGTRSRVIHASVEFLRVQGIAASSTKALKRRRTAMSAATAGPNDPPQATLMAEPAATRRSRR